MSDTNYEYKLICRTDRNIHDMIKKANKQSTHHFNNCHNSSNVNTTQTNVIPNNNNDIVVNNTD